MKIYNPVTKEVMEMDKDFTYGFLHNGFEVLTDEIEKELADENKKLEESQKSKKKEAE